MRNVRMLHAVCKIVENPPAAGRTFSILDRMPHPDVMFALRLPPELAVRRKPDEPEPYVRRRAELMWETDWSRSEACVVDASQPLPRVIAGLKTELWRRLA